MSAKGMMDVFSLRDSVVGEYQQFATAFTTIRADDIRQQGDAIYAGGWYRESDRVSPAARRVPLSGVHQGADRARAAILRDRSRKARGDGFFGRLGVAASDYFPEWLRDFAPPRTSGGRFQPVPAEFFALSGSLARGSAARTPGRPGTRRLRFRRM